MKEEHSIDIERRGSKRTLVLDVGIGKLVRQLSERSTPEVPKSEGEKFRQTLSSHSKLSPSDLESVFKTKIDTGLSQSEVISRIETYGENRLKEDPPVPLWRKVIEQFEDPVVLLLIASAIVSGSTGQFPEFVAIMLIVIVNAIIGLIQEGKAESSVKALASSEDLKCTVFRDGNWVSVLATHVVPGDILEIKLGDQVPADCILVKSENVSADEAQLTGESIPKKKYVFVDVDEETGIKIEENMSVLFAGTNVTSGSGVAIIVGTGMNTFRGTTASLLNSAESQESMLQVKLDDLGQKLGYASIVAGIVVFVVGITTHRGSDPNSNQPEWLQMLLIAVSLIVAAVPEGLPVCVSVALAIGMNKMAKMGALITGMGNVESLGSVTDICTDKTGTLTTGIMTVIELFDGLKSYTVDQTITFSEGAKKVLLIGKICNETKETTNTSGQVVLSGNMTDKAVYSLSKTRADACDFTLNKMNPFDSGVKMASAIVSFNNTNNPFKKAGEFCLVKGGWDVVLNGCNMTEDYKQLIIAQAKVYSAKAYRVICFAYKEIEEPGVNYYTNLTFCGLAGIQDPPRDDVAQAIAACKMAHITVRMITGDALDTGFAIAKKFGILDANAQSGAIDCKILRENGSSEEEIDKIIEDNNVFTRALPEDKIRIVKSLQKRGRVVAMTGDGVNDSPALKQADMGVAMGSGTTVAKTAGKMILMNDSFATIVKAVEEGRRIYANISKFVYFLLTTNPAEVFLILISTLLGLQSALSPTQILWLNLASDLFSALALIMEPLEPYLMTQKPRQRNATMLDSYMFKSIVFHTIVQTTITLGSYIWALYHFSNGTWNETEDEEVVVLAQTVCIYVIVFCELARSFTSRSLKYSVFSLNPFSNLYVPVAYVGAIGCTVLLGYVPGLQDVFDMVSLYDGTAWGVIIGVSCVPAVCDELFKAFSRWMKWI
jgi:Ca2+-transporting ATPase